METPLYFHIAVLWVMTHYSLASGHLHCHLLEAPFGLVRECRCFRGAYASIMRQKYCEEWKSLLLNTALEVILTFHGTSTLKMEVVCSCNIFVTTYLDTRPQINIVQPVHYFHTYLYSSNQRFMHHILYKELPV